MKVLTITSFYSGLRQSVLNDDWKPQGMPAFYKLLEGFKENDISFDSALISTHNHHYESQNLQLTQFPNTTFYIICHDQRKSVIRITDQYQYYKQLSKILIQKLRFAHYDLLYLDRASAGLLPFLKKAFKGRIVLRLHGVGTLYQNYSDSLKFRLLNWWRMKAFHTPIDLLISSRDGTPVPSFVKRFVHPTTPVHVLLNGVYKPETIEVQTNEEIRFLFIGRLESDKGIREVVKAFLQLDEAQKEKCWLDIVGDGGLRQEVEQMIKAESHIKCHGPVNHTSVREFYVRTDAIVSTNFLGNISNVVLEAIVAGNAIVTLDADVKANYDQETQRFLGDCAFYVKRQRVTADLHDLLNKLIPNPNQLMQKQKMVQKQLQPQLKSWEDRILTEIRLLQEMF